MSHPVFDILRDHADEVALTLLGEPNRRLSTKNEWRYGKKGSLSVCLNGGKRGRWFDHEQDEGGQMFKLASRELGGDAKAFAWAEERFDVPKTDRDGWKRSPHDENAGRRLQARSLYEEASPAKGSPAEAYLASRGCDAAIPSCLRFHGAPPANPGAAIGSLISPIIGVRTGILLGVHITYFGPLGHLGKKVWGSPRDPSDAGIIPLSAPDTVTTDIGLCEGIETGLSLIKQGYGPLWACLNAGHMGAFPIMPGIESIMVWADHDDAGKRAAASIYRRYNVHYGSDEKAPEIRARIPDVPGQDWNDVHGRAA